MLGFFYQCYKDTFGTDCSLNERALLQCLKNSNEFGSEFASASTEQAIDDLSMRYMPDMLDYVNGILSKGETPAFESFGGMLDYVTGGRISDVDRVRRLYGALYETELVCSQRAIEFWIDQCGTDTAAEMLDIITALNKEYGRTGIKPDAVPISLEAAKLIVPIWENSGRLSEEEFHDMVKAANNQPSSYSVLQRLVEEFNYKQLSYGGVRSGLHELAPHALSTFREIFGADPYISEADVVNKVFTKSSVFNEATFQSQREAWLRIMFNEHPSVGVGKPLYTTFLSLFKEQYNLFLGPDWDALYGVDETLFKCRILTMEDLVARKDAACWYHLSHNYERLGRYICMAACNIYEEVTHSPCPNSMMWTKLVQANVDSYKKMVDKMPDIVGMGMTKQDLMVAYAINKVAITWEIPSMRNRGGRGYIGAYRNSYEAWCDFVRLVDKGYTDVCEPMAKASNEDCTLLNMGILYLHIGDWAGKWDDVWKPIVSEVIESYGVSDNVEFWANYNTVTDACVQRLMREGLIG